MIYDYTGHPSDWRVPCGSSYHYCYYYYYCTLICYYTNILLY